MGWSGTFASLEDGGAKCAFYLHEARWLRFSDILALFPTKLNKQDVLDQLRAPCIEDKNALQAAVDADNVALLQEMVNFGLHTRQDWEMLLAIGTKGKVARFIRASQAVLMAVYEGHVKSLRRIFMSEPYVTPNVRFDKSPIGVRMPLHWATRKYRADIVRILLDHGADVNAEGSFGDTALHVASDRGFDNLVSLFLERHANPNAQNKQGLTPLHMAAEKGCVACAEFLLHSGSDSRVPDEHGNPALFYAVGAGNIDIARLLSRDSSFVTTFGLTALHIAAENGQDAIARLLIDGGADVNAMIKGTHETPLHFAVSEGHIAVVAVLLQNGADTEIQDSNGVTVLLDGVIRDRATIVRMLLDAGANANSKNNLGQTALMLAALKGNMDIARDLLSRQATLVDEQDLEGNSAFHYLPRGSQVAMVDLLHSKQSDINRQNAAGNTPLHYAASEGYVPVIDAMMKKGAAILSNAQEKTPMDFALEHVRTAAFKRLQGEETLL